LAAAPAAPNAENFQLSDFAGGAGATLLERVSPFVQAYAGFAEQGLALYSREVLGPTASRVLVRDPRSGEARSMLMMGSNNYLGLATHPHVQAAVRAAITEF